MRYIPHVLLAAFLLSCGDDEYPVALEKNQVTRLLTQNNSKIWVLASEVDCEKDNTLTFQKAADAKNLPAFIYAKGEILCEEESDDDITGTWEIISAPASNQLILHGAETTTYDIELITATTLHLRVAETEFKYIAL